MDERVGSKRVRGECADAPEPKKRRDASFIDAPVRGEQGKASSSHTTPQSESPCGVVRIGRKRPRGVSGACNPVEEGFMSVDATSGSGRKFGGQWCREAFSPFFLGPIDENELFGGASLPSSVPLLRAKNFENYWQYGKIFRELHHLDADGNVTTTWHTFRKRGYAKKKADRHPEGTKTSEVKFVDSQGRRRFRYLAACSSMYLGEQLGYVASRKKIYAPVYAWYVKRSAAFKAARQHVLDGGKLLVLDFDVPADGKTHVVTVDLLRQRINDESVPFGHGNVLAGLLAGIEPEEYGCDALTPPSEK